MTTECSITTFTGKQFNVFDPRVEDFHIEDIASGLSQRARFTGQCYNFYSVAQHSVYVSLVVDPEFALWGLLHDAAEAYLPDVAGPIKPYAGFLIGTRFVHFQALENKLLRLVGQRFELDGFPMPAEVEGADRRMLAAERQALFGAGVGTWDNLRDVVPADVPVLPVPSSLAKERFLERFGELCGR
jgi:hypothetical protein